MIPATPRRTSIPGGQVGEIDVDMPFVGRQAALDTAWPHIIERAGKTSSTYNRLKHPRLFAAGTPGIGKTRFGVEFPSLLEKKAQDTITSIPESKFILDRLSTKRVTVMVSFINGSTITETDLKWQTTEEKVDWILTSRAMYYHYNIPESYSKWASKLAASLGDELPPEFSFSVFLDKLTENTNPTSIYFHMDEFQVLLNYDFAVHVLREFSTQYEERNSHQLLTLLVYSGTVFTEVTKLFGDQWGHSSNYPLVPLPLENLTNELVFQLIESMQVENKLPWLPSNWRQQKEYLKLFAYTGGVPRIIELLLGEGKRSENLDEVAHAVTTKVQARYQFDSKVLETSCNIVLSGKNFEMTDIVPPLAMSIEKLCSQGSIYNDRTTQKLSIPYLYFRMAMFDKRINLIGEKQMHLTEINEYLTRLGAPCSTLNWAEFEQVNLIHEILKINSLMKLGYRTSKIGDYFKKSLICSKSIESLELQLNPRVYLELKETWPETSLGWPKSCLGITLTMSNIFDYIFLNAAGSSMDGFYFVQTTGGQVLLFALQNKHTIRSGDTLTFTEIQQEVWKMCKCYAAWQEITSKSSKNKNQKKADPVLQMFKQMKPGLVSVIFTNRSITKGDEIDLKNFSLENRLIVVHNPDYYAPWEQMLEFFSTHKNKNV